MCPAAKRPVHAREEPVLSRVLPVHEETAHLQPRLHQQGCAGEDGEHGEGDNTSQKSNTELTVPETVCACLC